MATILSMERWISVVFGGVSLMKSTVAYYTISCPIRCYAYFDLVNPWWICRQARDVLPSENGFATNIA